nr:lanthionine synthetase LanC family protein [Alkalimonas sp.]
MITGLPGPLLFQWYAAKADFCAIDTIQFQQDLQQITSSVHLLGRNTTFGYGLAGYGWLLELLLAEQADDYDPDFNQEIEDFLLADIRRHDTWAGDIEFVLGLSGVAAFAARRCRNHKKSELYFAIVDAFSKIAMYESKTACCWSTPAHSLYRFDKNHPEKPEYNLGLAHGVPAVICALLPAIEHSDRNLQARKLVSDGCNWLVSQTLSANPERSFFSHCSGEQHPSRLGWCYGDLTIALTLARAGAALERPDLTSFARTVAIHAASRDAKSAMVVDAGLCHGSAGLMLIFQLLNNIIPDPALAKASDYWCEHTLRRYREDGIPGLYAFKSGDYVMEHGLLEGLSGIGLCLLANQGVAPDWADAFLLA